MLSLNRKEKVNRYLSVILIYVLFIHEIVPFARASQNVRSNYSAINVNRKLTSENKSNISVLASEDKSIEVLHDIEMPYDLEGSPEVLQASAPGQSESSGFSIGSTDGMVDKFSGDFTYSIPLMDVEGYPVVLNYNSNIGMNQEASWVGLGWDLNVGSISREMRGLPDEFNGEQAIIKTVNQLDDATINGNKTGLFAQFGVGSIGVGFSALYGSYQNTYTGLGKTFDFSVNAAYTKSTDKNFVFGGSASFGFKIDTKNGLGRNASLGLNAGHEKDNGKGTSGGVTYGKNFNSRAGVLSQMIGARYRNHNIGSTLTYGSLTSVPGMSYNGLATSDYNSFTPSVTFGIGNAGITAGVIASTYQTNSGLDYTNSGQVFSLPAFGYLHSAKRKNYTTTKNEYPVMDFNRSSNSQFSEEMKDLAFSFQTYDVFRANAYGMSGSFRSRRTDVGTYYDAKATIEGDGGHDDIKVGVKLGAPPTFSIGYEWGDDKTDTESANWTQSGDNLLEFEGAGSTLHNFDNNTYFKAIGEPTPENGEVLAAFGGSSAYYIDVNKVGGDIVRSNFLKIGNGGVTIDGSAINQLTPRPIISTLFKPTIATQAEQSWFPFRIETLSGYQQAVGYRVALPYREDNHISTIDVVSNNGMQYTYGIPAYNIETNEVSFAIDEAVIPNADNTVTYGSIDNSINNSNGRSHYYTKTTTPGYAHSFLLTEMRSSNYIDATANGLTADDIGSYYKFNHTQIYGNESGNGNFLWRFPMCNDLVNQAMFNRGFEGSKLDNMANYSYGEKEIWYTHSVESKNLVAVFELKDRDDAYGVLTEDGVLDGSKPLKKLDKIVLYNISDMSTPLQTIEFKYDYSLCKNNPANINSDGNPNTLNSGKLTLTEIRVFSGESTESGLAKYEFVYSPENPSFNYADVDAWGNYKPNETLKPNHIFPYPTQVESDADDNIQAWKMIAINNPMGGKLEVEYEADRYVTVQDRKTMRHFDTYKMTNLLEFLYLKSQATWDGTDKVSNNFVKDFGGYAGLSTWLGGLGISNFPNFYNQVFKFAAALTYTSKFGNFNPNFVPNNVIIFELDAPLNLATYTGLEAEEYVLKNYFATGNAAQPYLKEILFKTHVQVKSGVYEYIPTFATISSDYDNPFSNLLPFGDDFNAVGVMPAVNGEYKYGYVVIDPVNSGARERKNKEGTDNDGLLMHPIQKSALEFIKQNLPDVVYGSCVGCDPNLSVDVATFFGGDMYKYMIDEGDYAPSFISDHSTMRMHIPGNIKYGGNARVSSITYKDNWKSITENSEYDGVYTWNYKYPSRADESGVASFEPRIAIDESPFYYWSTYINPKKKFPDERNFTPTPITADLFPIPTVGYADIRVEFEGGVSKGYSKAEFFTAADYPTIEGVTEIEKSHVNNNLPSYRGFGLTKELFGFTQGFSIQTNDYHGQPKEFSLYKSYGGTPVIQSRSTYIYKWLTDKVNVIDRDGAVNAENIAMEYDIHADSRFNYTKTTSITLGGGLNFTPPIILKPYFSRPTYTKRQSGFYTYSLVKHINRSAVLDRIETEYLNSINTARNLMYDKYTGNVLLSSLTDEYEDKLYSLSYPSHWYEAELRDVNSVENRTSINLNIAGGVLDISSISEDFFTVGDKLNLWNGGVNTVVRILSLDGDFATLIKDDDGTLYTSGTNAVTVDIVKTGRKNRLMETMQSVVSKKKMEAIPGSDFVFPAADPLAPSAESEIISGSAINYRNRTNLKCYTGDGHKVNNEVLLGSVINPFDHGIMGDLVLDGQFSWQTGRLNTFGHGTRFNGVYESFIPFYALDDDKIWRAIDDLDHPYFDLTMDKWRKLGEVTAYDQYGKAVQSEDQLKIASSVLYGFNNELALFPVAQAVNAKENEIAFDGFEDYSFYTNPALQYNETHFDFKSSLSNDVQINETVRHSGLASLEINAGSSASVVKGVLDPCLTPGSAIIPSEGNIAAITADQCYCTLPFRPSIGKYVVSAWVKVGNDNTRTDYSDGAISITISGQAIIPDFIPTGPILDGWQRIEGVFEILSSPVPTGITVELKNETASESVYFDDLRIHPFLAGMTTTVYNPKTLLPMATHDGYNFTTFYNYDENLNQVRIRIETIEGIKTIVESEFGGQKTFND